MEEDKFVLGREYEIGGFLFNQEKEPFNDERAREDFAAKADGNQIAESLNALAENEGLKGVFVGEEERLDMSDYFAAETAIEYIYYDDALQNVMAEAVSAMADERQEIKLTLLSAEEFYKRVMDKKVFNVVYVDYGITVWKDGEIDVSPEYLYHYSCENKN